MHRLVRIAFVLAVAAILAPAAGAATRMPVGFQDDPTFRWIDGAPKELDRVQQANATIIRAIVDWSAVAPTRPKHATHPFDKAYQLNDLDDMIRNAQQRGIQVMLTIWGTPKWANGGQGPNVPPKRMRDLRNFAQALANRYSGRHAGYPYVGYYSVWNEPNLEIFLTPQFDKKGKITSPATYAKLYKAAYAGIKKSNKYAKVAIGETSNRGRDHPAKGGANESVAPGTFARLLAKVKGLKFDAYATHPYATRMNLPPSQKVRFPNVTLTRLTQFEGDLDKWFHRKDVPVWITEYGYEVRPADKLGTTKKNQAAWMAKAMHQLQKDPHVQMFIWFIFRDSKDSLWQSGVYTQSGKKRPSYNTFKKLAAKIAGETIDVKPGRVPKVTLAVPELAFSTKPGQKIGVDFRIYDGKKLIDHDQAAPKLTKMGTVWFRPARFKPEAGTTYTVKMIANSPSGAAVSLTYDLATSGGDNDKAVVKKKKAKKAKRAHRAQKHKPGPRKHKHAKKKAKAKH